MDTLSRRAQRRVGEASRGAVAVDRSAAAGTPAASTRSLLTAARTQRLQRPAPRPTPRGRRPDTCRAPPPWLSERGGVARPPRPPSLRPECTTPETPRGAPPRLSWLRTAKAVECPRVRTPRLGPWLESGHGRPLPVKCGEVTEAAIPRRLESDWVERTQAGKRGLLRPSPPRARP
jgi:hypothetical protein